MTKTNITHLVSGIPDGPYVPARPGPPPEASDEQADYISIRSEFSFYYHSWDSILVVE